MPQLNMDCEGPLTQNDNAYELCEVYIPDGGKFFSRISRYDDYLADVEQRPGYRAGDTLKLVLPFLKAFGVTNSQMERFAEKTLMLLPGTREMLPRVSDLLPSFIISTSYRPYLEALCRLTGFPMDQVYCTEVDLDRYSLSDSERDMLRSLAREIASQPMLSWPEDASGIEELAEEDQKTLRRLDEIFWKEVAGLGIGRIFLDVQPVGGVEKANAVEDSLGRTGFCLRDVIYIGDSITDVQALELVRGGGGLAISFNGNGYALRAANWAIVCGDTSIIGAVSELVFLKGPDVLEELFEKNGCGLAGKTLTEMLDRLGVTDRFIRPLKGLDGDMGPKLFKIGLCDMTKLVKMSESVRKKVRGIGVGQLG